MNHHGTPAGHGPARGASGGARASSGGCVVSEMSAGQRRKLSGRDEGSSRVRAEPSALAGSLH